jgi:hypothetical protein
METVGEDVGEEAADELARSQDRLQAQLCRAAARQLAACEDLFPCCDYRLAWRRRKIKPARPAPSRAKVEGSGVVTGGTPVDVVMSRICLAPTEVTNPESFTAIELLVNEILVGTTEGVVFGSTVTSIMLGAPEKV